MAQPRLSLHDYDMSGNSERDFDALVENLGVKQRRAGALRLLMLAGPACTEALRRGLSHEDPAVRVGCCMVLDHYMDDAALPELIANLDHENEEVRSWALHALACDRCKEGECRPGEDDVVPVAVRVLGNDSSRRVRAQAAGMLGPAALKRADAVRALERAREEDSDPTVRKIAGWFVPGGPRYERLARLESSRR